MPIIKVNSLYGTKIISVNKYVYAAADKLKSNEKDKKYSAERVAEIFLYKATN